MIFCLLSRVNSESLLLKPLSHRRGDKDKSKVWIKNVFVLSKASIRHPHWAEIILVASTSWTQPFPLLIGTEWETNTQSVRQTPSMTFLLSPRRIPPSRQKQNLQQGQSFHCQPLTPSRTHSFPLVSHRPQSPSAHPLLFFYPVCLKKRAHGS